jgi:hypothetical protein
MNVARGAADHLPQPATVTRGVDVNSVFGDGRHLEPAVN